MTGNELRELRRSLRVSQYALAGESGVPRMHLSLAENGDRELSPEEAQAISRALAHFASRRYDEMVAIRAEISAPTGVQVSA